MKQKKYDAIIIGAGLGGLTAALNLAKNNKKILIIEQHNKVGGYATNFTRKKFKFEVSLHNYGSLIEDNVIKHIFKKLEIENNIKPLPFNTFQRIIFPDHDYLIKTGVNNFIQYLKKQFPNEEEGIENLFKDMEEIFNEFTELDKLDITIENLEEEFPMLPVKFPMLIKCVEKTFGELVNKHINDNKLKGLIGNNWWITGLPLSKTASILHSIVSMTYYNYRGGLIEGTSQNLSNALADQIKSSQGKILLNEKVKKIIINDNKASGVSTDKGIYLSDIIISNSNPIDTFITLPDKQIIAEKYKKKIAETSPSLSGIQLYLGLDCNPHDIGMKDHSITISNSYDTEENYNWILNGDYKNSFITMTNFSAFDKTLAPEKKGVLNIFSLDHIKNWEGLNKDEYKNQKKVVTNILIKKAEKIIPGLSNHIEIMELGTPLTMKKYTSHPEGAIYASDHTIHQSGINRLSYKSSLNGLFIVGAYIYPGAGFSSVISSGYKISNEILKNMK